MSQATRLLPDLLPTERLLTKGYPSFERVPARGLNSVTGCMKLNMRKKLQEEDFARKIRDKY
jgi:hypothetical protein